MCIAPPLSVLNSLSYTVVMDAAPGPDNLDSNLRLSWAADPKVLQLRKDSKSVDLGVNDSIISIEVISTSASIVYVQLLFYAFRDRISLM